VTLFRHRPKAPLWKPDPKRHKHDATAALVQLLYDWHSRANQESNTRFAELSSRWIGRIEKAAREKE